MFQEGISRRLFKASSYYVLISAHSGDASFLD